MSNLSSTSNSERREALRFLGRMALFGLLFLGLDRCFLWLRYEQENLFARIALEKMDRAYLELVIKRQPLPKILVVGASHGQFGVDPDILNSRLHTTTYNLAYGDGAHIGDQLNLLRAYLGYRKAPDTILYDMHFTFFQLEPYSHGRFVKVFVGSQTWQAAFQEWKTKLPGYFYSFRYGRNLERYLEEGWQQGDWSIPNTRVQQREGVANAKIFSSYSGYEVMPSGFVRAQGRLNPSYVRYGELDFELNQKWVEVLEQYIQLCRDKKIRLVFYQPPEHKVAQNPNRQKFESWFADFCRQRGIEYRSWNDAGDFPLDNDAYFFDSDHLNADGAAIFSVKLADWLATLPSSPP